MRTRREEPQWLHIGAGNIFRGFIAGIAQTLLNAGELTRGIIAADSFDGEIIDKIYKPFDNLTLNVSLCSDGTTKSEVTASVCEALKADPTCEADIARLKEIARSPHGLYVKAGSEYAFVGAYFAERL